MSNNTNLSSLTDQEVITELNSMEQNSNVQEDETEAIEKTDVQDTDETTEESDTEFIEEEELESTEEEEEELESTESLDLDNLLNPIKLNDTEFEIDNIEEARQLMELGVKYNNDVLSSKPQRKLAKMLADNDIDENKLNHLIDISKGNTKAISKLLADSNIDPLDFEEDSENSYVPNDHSVSDNSLLLDDVIQELNKHPNSKDTYSAIRSMDTRSQEVLSSNPAGIRLLHEHINNGIYSKVMSRVNKLSTLGQLDSSLSKLEAYQLVGNKMSEEGAFSPVKKNTVVSRKVKRKMDSTRPHRSKRTNTNSSSIDSDRLTDEEFMQMLNSL